MLRSFLIGAAAGALFSIGYVLFGSWGWFVPEPLWAEILLAPGVAAGWAFYDAFGVGMSDSSLAVNLSMGVGVLAMAVVCGALGCVFLPGSDGREAE